MNIPKQDNMAAVEEVAPEEAMLILEEPIRADLKEMLVDIQINISNILRENEQFSDDMERLSMTRSAYYAFTLAVLCIHSKLFCKRIA